MDDHKYLIICADGLQKNN